MKTNIWLVFAIECAVFALLLFGGAGTMRWPQAWIFLLILFGTGGMLTGWLVRKDPALLAERMKPPFQRGQPLWDKMLVPVLIAIFVGWLLLMGLDAKRYQWSHVPLWLEVIGGMGIAVGMWICYLAFRENPFLAAVVRIQNERGQRVIDTGPCSVVRHPLYAATLILLPGSALLLGSLYGLAGAVAMIGLLAMRTVLEERELEHGLEGYAEYTRRVRYRFVPGVW